MALFSRAASAALVGAAVMLVAGCGSGEKEIDISGKVTFKGEPVTEGQVQFIEDRTGRGTQVDLDGNGMYKATLFPGDYKVAVTPPYIVDESSGMPNPSWRLGAR